MSDLISRQAAIDAIEPTLKSILQGNSFKAINVIDKIRDLPSAQPEPIKVSVDREMTEEELKELKKKIADSPVVLLPSAQPDVSDINVGDINKFIDGLEETFADIRERNGDDIVCGLCEFDGAYIGESGDWCNECPGFNRDDCFKLRDKIRKKWIAEITACLPSAQPEPCEDAVSRKAVEEMLKNGLPKRGMWEIEGDVVKQTVCETLADALMDLEKLPSAQPKILACGNGELNAQPEQRWIPCSERLPETPDMVLVTIDWGDGDYEVSTDEYWSIDGVETEGWGNLHGEVVTAWMPRPEPYKGEQE